MEDDYFSQAQGETVTSQQNSSHQRQPDDDEAFNFEEDSNQIQMSNPSSLPTYVAQSYSDPLQEDKNLKRVRQEQERINIMLRQKANTEYQQKQKRKEEGKRQLEEFLAEKQQQKDQRKETNLKKEEQQKAQVKTLNLSAGWRKVIANIPLKQGEHPSSKDTNRMRESILHKREDLDREQSN